MTYICVGDALDAMLCTLRQDPSDLVASALMDLVEGQGLDISNVNIRLYVSANVLGDDDEPVFFEDAEGEIRPIEGMCRTDPMNVNQLPDLPLSVYDNIDDVQDPTELIATAITNLANEQQTDVSNAKIRIYVCAVVLDTDDEPLFAEDEEGFLNPVEGISRSDSIHMSQFPDILMLVEETETDEYDYSNVLEFTKQKKIVWQK